MNDSEQLSLEQEFELRKFAAQVRTLSPEASTGFIPRALSANDAQK